MLFVSCGEIKQENKTADLKPRWDSEQEIITPEIVTPEKIPEPEIKIDDEKKSMRIVFCNILDEEFSVYGVSVRIVVPDCVKLMISGDKDKVIAIAAEIKNDPVTMKKLRELGFKEIYFTNMWGYGYHLYL